MDTSDIEAVPIDHWSHSSLGLLLRNPLAFKKKYMLKIYDSKTSPSGVVGQACHKAVEVYLKQECDGIEDAISQGLKELNSVFDGSIDYGKTGSREQMLKDYTQAVRFYFEEMPPWEKRGIVFVEQKLTKVIHDHMGEPVSLPAKCFVDVVWRSERKETFAGRTYPKGTLFIEDNKFVRSYSDDSEVDPTRLRQAFFNWLIVREELGKAPAAMLFREVKISKNKDNTPQCQYYVIHFEDFLSELPVFFQLYNDATRFVMNPQSIYLPNPSDMFDGKDSWLSYRQQLITADAPMPVVKTKEVRFQEKKYVESASAKVENRNLSPEEMIRTKLQEFAMPVEMQQTHTGSSITMYTLRPSRGVKMSTIEAHAKDLALALKARSIRVQAPIMGTDLVGIEVPNEKRDVIPFMLEGKPREDVLAAGTLAVPIGVDVYGGVIVKDLREMPHLLIAGATGAGKSVMLNVALHALTNQMTPDKLQLMLFDPKRVELAMFADVPHLISDVITEQEEALNALVWLNEEMDSRYKKLQAKKVRNITDYKGKMPYIVAVIDEFADLVLSNRIMERTEKLKTSVKMASKRTTAAVQARLAAKEGKLHIPDLSGLSVRPSAEELIVRLAQKSRAVGIHLIIATQRPTVDVVTGLIKANMPARIAFATTSGSDSRVILDQQGAEELLGRGDMLFLDPSNRGLLRLQGFYA